jgi:hypothetical protein
MSDNFVGFAQSPKLDPLRDVVSKTMEFSASSDIKFAIQLISTEAGLSSWLGKLAKFDFRQGAKLKYGEEGNGATFALIQIPKRFVVVAETLGEVDLRFKEQKASYQLTITVKKALLASELEAWEQDVAKLEQVFRGVVNG